MRITWLIATNRGDILWAAGKADYQVHFARMTMYLPLFTDWRMGLDHGIGFDWRVLPEIERRRQLDRFQA